ncbi:hypothetical protein AXG93_4295s1770 [Marchantia polymorpha subsp. ruderalis]|uniref:Uncharacterized protein n=1 Tax=Marchantia polymorpha subsp. ruderalis TaxID=1480154 RepID=A0A176WC60_MARPO|nr:hypothetical protein AXG93_4295s1770 [Marchantia polymorpha subsp. ruderalis]
MSAGLVTEGLGDPRGVGLGQPPWYPMQQNLPGDTPSYSASVRKAMGIERSSKARQEHGRIRLCLALPPPVKDMGKA